MLLSPRRAPRRPAPLLAAACLALLVAGCGGGSNKPKSTASAAHSAFLAYSECMRSHGVPNFPDPSSGGGINIGGTGLNPSSPSFQAAQTACQHELPGGGPPQGKPSEQTIHAMLATSECMRAHGVTGFPDPTEGAPPTNTANYSVVMDRGGVLLAIPKSIDVNSPQFQHASAACQFGPGSARGAKVVRAG